MARWADDLDGVRVDGTAAAASVRERLLGFLEVAAMDVLGDELGVKYSDKDGSLYMYPIIFSKIDRQSETE